ncbi:hypothetical protein L1049_010675 [Liquidambar formosana]|uniref:EF-hand domain-containing protein n=1 Tax=Liquidambar formosana TaxID=63359 RepID=A0AAP0N7Z6_LIQFO
MSRAAFIKNFDPISNGIDHKSQYSSILEFDLRSTTVTCEPLYGFLPCTTELWGQLFLIVVYEYLLSLGQKYVSDGSDLFFKMFGTGIFGASLFHILGTIPIVAMLLVNGISGSKETAEGLASMGVGMLAGSAVMSLTLIWGSCVAFGSYDLSKTDTLSNLENKRQFSLTGFGVTTDVETSYTARIMLLSMIPFIILQLPKILNSSSVTRVAVLISLVIALVFLLVYCFYQVFQPWIQSRRLEYLMHKYVKDNLLKTLLTSDGNPSTPKIRELFHHIDRNNDKYISTAELRALILGMRLEEVGLSKDDYVAKVMEEFDSSGDAHISETEFVSGITKWLKEANHSANNQHQDQPKILSRTSKKTGEEEQQMLVAQKKKSQGVDNSWLNHFKAAFLLILGTAISVLLAQPLMEAVQDFASAANVPSFFVSYIVIPFAMSYRQALSAITSARKKTERAISLTFSEIYGGVFVSNMICLAMFLLIVYIRDLAWEASAQVLVVLIIGLVVGIYASFSTKFPFWTCIVAYVLYPISLTLIYFLATVLGWS